MAVCAAPLPALAVSAGVTSREEGGEGSGGENHCVLSI